MGASRAFTLWMMKIYAANRLVGVSAQLNVLNLFLSKIETEGGLTPTLQSLMIKSMTLMMEQLDELGLELTKKSVVRFAESLDKINSALEGLKYWEDVSRRFHDEVANIQFIYVEDQKMKYYDQEAAFGDEVRNRFPSAEYDIREASNCFALDRYTACVMHSMRVLETGLNALATALKVKRSTRGWGTDINMFADEWQKQIKSKPKLSGWRRRFFPQAFADFRYFAAAWRNHAMHSTVEYGETESGRVFEHVQSFMQHLSSRLGERKKR